MLTTQPIDIQALINSRAIGGFQKWVVFLGFLIWMWQSWALSHRN
jgi:AAHS family 4-hydroxybenzoate transporter-like MFS transporter